jgi:NitT/TauT family transport system substrate-binding protein
MRKEETDMKHWKQLLALVLTLALALSLAGCGKTDPQDTEDQTEEQTEEVTGESYAIAALKGPTAMGLVKLMSDTDEKAAQMLDSSKPYEGEVGNLYTFTLAASADEVSPLLMKGELDMACVPANLAAVLYQKTEGDIVTLAVNTLGVLYIVENGNAVTSMADLAGKTIVASGKGSTPEYALRYLLSENGLDPDADVTIDWKSEHSECVTALATGAATIAMLPQPFVTVAENKISGLRTALDLTEQWDALDNGSALLTGVIVARREVVEQNPAAVDAFLKDYAGSVEWVNANPADAAELIGSYGIVEAAVAEKALPHCNIVCITGAEMKDKLSGYLQVLFDADASSVGGALPGDDFYYGA